MWVKHLRARFWPGWGGKRGCGPGCRVEGEDRSSSGGLKSFEHRSHLNIASTLGVPRLVSVSASVDHSPWPVSSGGENESSGGQQWRRDRQILHSPK